MKASARARLANDLPGRSHRLVSIHANAHGNGRKFTDASGIAVLHYPGSVDSARMAEVFQERLVARTGWRDRGTKKRSNLSLLKRTSMPAIITESGFYTNRAECEAQLQNSSLI